MELVKNLSFFIGQPFDKKDLAKPDMLEDFLEEIQKLPVDKAVEVSMKYGTVRDRLKRLVKAGKLKGLDFSVVSHTVDVDGKKTRLVYLVRSKV